MKRTFHGTVGYTRGSGSVDLYADRTSTTAFANYKDFAHILGVRCQKDAIGELDLTLHLIGTPMLWCHWEWSDGEEYQPNRLIVFQRTDWLYFGVFVPDGPGKRQVLTCCPDEFEKIFPGLVDTLGDGNACEVDITVTARRRENG